LKSRRPCLVLLAVLMSGPVIAASRDASLDCLTDVEDGLQNVGAAGRPIDPDNTWRPVGCTLPQGHTDYSRRIVRGPTNELGTE
jgi:hypothetical protein